MRSRDRSSSRERVLRRSSVIKKQDFIRPYGRILPRENFLGVLTFEERQLATLLYQETKERERLEELGDWKKSRKARELANETFSVLYGSIVSRTNLDPEIGYLIDVRWLFRAVAIESGIPFIGLVLKK